MFKHVEQRLSVVLPDLNSDPDLNLELNLGPANVNAGVFNINNTLANVLCRRCHSSSHPRHACKSPIKCDVYFGWGHVAASCRLKWERLQENMKGRQVDTFSKCFGSHLNYSRWFKPSSMTAGPSTPPRCLDFADFSGGTTSSRTIHWSLPLLPLAPEVQG